jgi:hypothetical protein
VYNKGIVAGLPEWLDSQREEKEISRINYGCIQHGLTAFNEPREDGQSGSDVNGDMDEYGIIPCCTFENAFKMIMAL